MKRKSYQTWRVVLGLILILTFVPWVLTSLQAQREMPVSKPGQYRGYSQPIYNQWLRTSQYVAVRDGTKLAVDIFRPARNGKPVDDPLPVIWTQDRYHRADLEKGKLMTQLDQMPWLQTVIKHGYVVGVVDIRGGGASFGTWPAPFTRKEALDAYDITEWFAAQPWCSGRVGMYGRSYLGITQYMAASTAPPHLKAIFPEMAMFDLYSFVYPGGVFHNDFATHWSQSVKELDTTKPAAPVDGDRNGVWLAKALAQHKTVKEIFDLLAPPPYRDSRSKVTNSKPYFELSPSGHLSQIKRSGVAVYHLAGWYDMWPRDALVWFKNLDHPQKIVIGPWSHSQSDGFDLAAEHLRWYDYWLKDIDNGVTKEPPIYYYTMGAPPGKEWRSAGQWPLPNQKPTRYYFERGPSGSIDSANDGWLSTQPPTSPTGQDDYTVDYSTTSGTATRWTKGYAGPFGYPDMRANDKKALTYTTPLLNSDVEVTGHPIVHLWVTSSAKDGDFFAYLEEVGEDGYSHYLTEGTLRASHRATSPPPFEYLGLPYHRSFEPDVADLPNKPVELVFDLHPTSNLFKTGRRIRVTITGADKDNALTPKLSPPPRVSLYRNALYASYIMLPIIPAAAGATPAAGRVSMGAVILGGASWPFIIAIVLVATAIGLLLVFKFNGKPASCGSQPRPRLERSAGRLDTACI
jgi:hypothetical protein